MLPVGLSSMSSVPSLLPTNCFPKQIIQNTCFTEQHLIINQFYFLHVFLFYVFCVFYRYSKAIEYWQKQDASVNGVLGGFEETSAPDLKASTKFLKQILALSDTKLPHKPTYVTALDCGAGMGRVTKGLLLRQFKEVDLVEPVGSLLEKAKTYVESKRAINFFEQPLQSFQPEPFRYDVIWNQWVLLYLPDDDLIAYLRKCAEALRENGLICVKENVVMEGQFILDDEDNSITRTHAQYRLRIG